MNTLENRAYIYQIELNSTQTNDARIIASNFVDNDSKVLDVGCACGDFGYYLSREKNCTVYGMEYDQESIQVALTKNIFQNIHQVDLNVYQTNEHSEYIGQFDYITLLDVLEHTISPEKSLLQLKPYIKEDGYFIISLPNISFGDIKISLLNDDFEYTDMGILDKTHLRFFTYKTIAQFFTSLNFEIMKCSVKVSNITASMEKIPFFIKNHIFKNPHSYAYQYVLKVKVSSLNSNELLKNNNSKMELQKKDISYELNKIKRSELIQYILPVGSNRREYIKSIYNKFKEKK